MFTFNNLSISSRHLIRTCLYNEKTVYLLFACLYMREYHWYVYETFTCKHIILFAYSICCIISTIRCNRYNRELEIVRSVSYTNKTNAVSPVPCLLVAGSAVHHTPVQHDLPVQVPGTRQQKPVLQTSCNLETGSEFR